MCVTHPFKRHVSSVQDVFASAFVFCGIAADFWKHVNAVLILNWFILELLCRLFTQSPTAVMFNHLRTAQMCWCAAVSKFHQPGDYPSHSHTIHSLCPFLGRPSTLSCRSLWRNTLRKKEPNRPCIKRCWVTRQTPVCRNTVPSPHGWEHELPLFKLFNTMHCLFILLWGPISMFTLNRKWGLQIIKCMFMP